MGEINGIRGAVATKSLQAGDVIVTAPKHSVLMVIDTSQPSLEYRYLPALTWCQCLVC